MIQPYIIRKFIMATKNIRNDLWCMKLSDYGVIKFCKVNCFYLIIIIISKS